MSSVVWGVLGLCSETEHTYEMEGGHCKRKALGTGERVWARKKAGKLAEPTGLVAAKESVLRISHCQANSQIYHNLNPDNEFIHFCGHCETICVFLCNIYLVCQFGMSLQSWYLKQNPFLIQYFPQQSKRSAYFSCRNAETQAREL